MLCNLGVFRSRIQISGLFSCDSLVRATPGRQTNEIFFINFSTALCIEKKKKSKSTSEINFVFTWDAGKDDQVPSKGYRNHTTAVSVPVSGVLHPDLCKLVQSTSPACICLHEINTLVGEAARAECVRLPEKCACVCLSEASPTFHSLFIRYFHLLWTLITSLLEYVIVSIGFLQLVRLLLLCSNIHWSAVILSVTSTVFLLQRMKSWSRGIMPCFCCGVGFEEWGWLLERKLLGKPARCQ